MHHRLTLRDATPTDAAVVAAIYNASAPEGDPVLGASLKHKAGPVEVRGTKAIACSSILGKGQELWSGHP